MKWWTENKLKLALVPALVFWVVSALCFVFGLSFQNPIGVLIWGWDVSMWIAIGLAIANTIIQIIGNDQDDMSTVLFVGWMASYVLGIGSNVNALLGVLHIESVFLEWAICVALGAMIEVLPEKLLVIFLKSIENKPRFGQQPFKNPDYRNNFLPNKPKNAPRPTPKPFPSTLPRYEPTYHPIGANSKNKSLFSPERYEEEE